jgi:non-homologous end joining protein Ku
VPELLRLAEHILDGKLRAFDPSGFRDRYEEVLMVALSLHLWFASERARARASAVPCAKPITQLAGEME